jgi:uncharacterized cupredoxin-like copper-binding protein
LKRVVFMFFGLLTLVSTGCATNEEAEPLTSPAAGASTIDVKLREYSVQPKPEVGTEGRITFNVKNKGTEEHEFVVVRSDSEPGELPTADDGSVDEKKVDVAGEVEELKPGTSDSVKLDLAAGSYVLFCNVVEKEHGHELEAHYKLGMRTGFTVR